MALPFFSDCGFDFIYKNNFVYILIFLFKSPMSGKFILCRLFMKNPLWEFYMYIFFQLRKFKYILHKIIFLEFIGDIKNIYNFCILKYYNTMFFRKFYIYYICIFLLSGIYIFYVSSKIPFLHFMFEI